MAGNLNFERKSSGEEDRKNVNKVRRMIPNDVALGAASFVIILLVLIIFLRSVLLFSLKIQIIRQEKSIIILYMDDPLQAWARLKQTFLTSVMMGITLLAVVVFSADISVVA